MFGNLKPQAQDGILALMQTYRDDPRPGKMDLGVGVYKDATGLTPVMRAVKTAEAALWQTQRSKTYTGLAGDPAFHAAMSALILGRAVDPDRIAAAAAPGGTGAIRQALELIALAAPQATVWLPDPTWPNHPSIIGYLRLRMRPYRYFNTRSQGVDMPGMMADLAGVRPGDVVLLHGCCHNPTGADPALAEWGTVADLLADRRAVPLVDLAYQGFGAGLEADAAATRLIAARCPEVLIAASCSKNFGIYRERAGILLAVGGAAQRVTLQGTLAWLNRQNWSFPPDHGARLVTMILNDGGLRADWQAELDDIRRSMAGLRGGLAQALRQATGSDRFDFVAVHRGMFSRLGLPPAQVETLRRDHAIYMVDDSRINIAGLNAETVPVLARAIASVAG